MSDPSDVPTTKESGMERVEQRRIVEALVLASPEPIPAQRLGAIVLAELTRARSTGTGRGPSEPRRLGAQPRSMSRFLSIVASSLRASARLLLLRSSAQ